MFFLDKLNKLIKAKTKSYKTGDMIGVDNSIIGSIRREKTYDSRPFFRGNEEFVRIGLAMAEGNLKFTLLFIILDMIISQPNCYHYSLSCDNVNEVRLKYGKSKLTKYQVSKATKLLLESGFIVKHPRISSNYMFDVSAVINGDVSRVLEQNKRESEDSHNKEEISTEALTNTDNIISKFRQQVSFSNISDTDDDLS